MRYQTNRFILVLLCVFASLLLFTPTAGQMKKQTFKKHLKLKLPDLTVSVKCPNKAYPGQELKKSIKVKISNIGTAGAKNFTVDIFLAKDRSSPKHPLVFSRRFKPYVLLHGGREHIRYLAAGATTWVTMHGLNKVPGDTPPGNYNLGVLVDSKKSVKELLESNNINWGVLWIGPHITNAVQYFDWMVAPTHEMEIAGTGFCNTQGNKTIKIGQYNISILPGGSWSNTKIYCHYPGNIPYGVHYPLYIMEGGNIISNQYDFFLKMVIFGNLFEPYHGPPGTTLNMATMNADSSQGAKELIIGDSGAQIQSWSHGSITVIVPNLPPGTYNVYIKKAGETISNVVTFTITAN